MKRTIFAFIAILLLSMPISFAQAYLPQATTNAARPPSTILSPFYGLKVFFEGMSLVFIPRNNPELRVERRLEHLNRRIIEEEYLARIKRCDVILSDTHKVRVNALWAEIEAYLQSNDIKEGMKVRIITAIESYLKRIDEYRKLCAEDTEKKPLGEDIVNTRERVNSRIREARAKIVGQTQIAEIKPIAV